MRVVVMTVGAILLLPIHGSSQISGQVLDSEGNPVTLALVELLGPSGVLGSVLTNAQGSFDLAPVANATEVRANQFGFESTVLGLDDLSKPLHFVLPPRPFEMAELRVEVAEASCPPKDILAAREVWEEVLSNTRDLTNDTYWAAFIYEWRWATGSGRDFGPFQDATFDWSSRGGLPESDLRLWIQGSSEGLVLARRRSAGDQGFPPEFTWQIPSLEGAGVPLLFSPELAKQSTISWGESAGSVVICYEDNNKVRVRFTTRHDDAGSLAEILWRIETPHPVERAGGILGFIPPQVGQALPLPRTSYFWHREEMGKNYQDYRVFSPWIVGGSEEVIKALRKMLDSLHERPINP